MAVFFTSTQESVCGSPLLTRACTAQMGDTNNSRLQETHG